MCAICHSAPCNPRCPNAPEPETVAECFFGCEIRVGDEYIEFDGDAVCKDCLKNMSLLQLMEFTDMTVSEILCELGGERKIGEAY